jgi:uncharacterized protein
LCFPLFEALFAQRFMIVDLSKLESSRAEYEFELSPNEIDFEGENITVIANIKVSANLEKHIAQTDVEGEISAKLEMDCSRCVSIVENDLEIPFSAAFVTPENYLQNSEKELEAGELDVSVIENEEIDLIELVREQILLAIPARFLCEEDCKGLCPICGANKNLIDCKCVDKEADPRWSALKNLIK